MTAHRWTVACLALIVTIGGGSGPLSTRFALSADPVDYSRQVKPLLTARCGPCHGALRQQSGLRLDTAQAIKKGGESGPAITPGKSVNSLLIQAVTDSGLVSRMPPEGEGERLSPDQIAMLAAWIDEGAKSPADEPVPVDPRQHWAFRPPVRAWPRGAAKDEAGDHDPKGAATGATNERATGSEAIDAWIDAALAERGLKHAPPAGKATLLRRVTLDLIGVPPTPGELREFLADDSPEAYERVVDRLLAHPGYGQRWGRHWMDVWRYSDPFGFNEEFRYSQRHIWRFRDWIVESLNRDLPYDRMIQEMLAGDELAPGDPNIERATGFLGRNWYKFNRHAWLQEAVDHTAMGFLGITLKCARCHDHKFDPFTQVDYYRFRAFFEPHDARADRVPGQPDTLKDGLARVYDATPDAPTYLFFRGDDRTPDKDHPLTPGAPALFAKLEAPIAPVALPWTSFYPALREFEVNEALAAARANVAAAEAEATALPMTAAGAPPDRATRLAHAKLATAQDKLDSLETRVAAERAKYQSSDMNSPDPSIQVTTALAAAQAERKATLAAAEESVLLAEYALADAQNPAPAGAANASPAAIKPEEAAMALESAKTALAAAQAATADTSLSYSPLGTIYPATSTGRRLSLARFITDLRNPLTARVAVNHVWRRHFGKPLVATMANFGTSGKRPTHPELLDQLAVEFMEGGWRFKALHRSIVLSAAYRRDSISSGEPNTLASDPENLLLGRMNSRRMEAEVIRDSLLAVAGSLDTSFSGAPLLESEGLTSARRSLYFRVSAEHKMQFLDLFDLASATECYERRESVVPQQALAMINSSLAIAQSRRLAQRLVDDQRPTAAAPPAAATDPETTRGTLVDLAFERVLGRSPSAPEREKCVDFLKRQETLAESHVATPFPAGPQINPPASADPRQRALENLILVVFNHHEFVTIR